MIRDLVAGLAAVLMRGPLLFLAWLVSNCLFALVGIGVGRRVQRRRDEDARAEVRLSVLRAREAAAERAGARAVRSMPTQRGGE